MDVRTRFTEHPASVGETYLEHFRNAARYSRELLAASLCAGIHALFPWTHCTTASTKIQALHDEMSAGGRGAFATDDASDERASAQ